MIKNVSLFIFRRDLRLYDNTALINACNNSDYVLPLFIFTPNQISNNKYKSYNSIQFMIESLEDLQEQIKNINTKLNLITQYGDEIEIIEKINKLILINSIYINDDYTPYSIKRDNRIKQYCENNNLNFIKKTDILLNGDNIIRANNGNIYYNFTLFYKKSITYPVKKPIEGNFNKLYYPKKLFKNWNLQNIKNKLIKNGDYIFNDKIAIKGGRSIALNILKNIKLFKNYKENRDYLNYSTTMMSAHNKYGTVSIREVYYTFIKEKKGELCKNLYWRDFYYYISINFESFYKYEHITKKNKSVKWDNNKEYFKKWSKGITGFPIVDAGMRQMNETGYMHNRARLIVSQFFCKDLLINWKYGEQYFSKKLVDIDRAQNLGNWNWSASFGLDNTQFLRIFNPWTQSKKFDKDCIYIKKWIPELINVPNKHIHQWDKYCESYTNIKYPKPIVEHNIQRKKFIKFYNKYFK